MDGGQGSSSTSSSNGGTESASASASVKKKMKYVCVTGGVVSGLGKGKETEKRADLLLALHALSFPSLYGVHALT